MGKKQNILPGKIWQLSEGTKQLAYQPDQIVHVGKSVYLKDFTEREVKIKKKKDWNEDFHFIACSIRNRPKKVELEKPYLLLA